MNIVVWSAETEVEVITGSRRGFATSEPGITVTIVTSDAKASRRGMRSLGSEVQKHFHRSQQPMRRHRTTLHYRVICILCLPEAVMHRFTLLLGLGAALLAAGACAQRPETQLTQAAVRNDVAALRQLLADGHKADEHGNSWTALIWASRSEEHTSE